MLQSTPCDAYLQRLNQTQLVHRHQIVSVIYADEEALDHHVPILVTLVQNKSKHSSLLEYSQSWMQVFDLQLRMCAVFETLD